jgi:transposase
MAADDLTIPLGLPGYRVTPQCLETEHYAIWVAPTALRAVCPRCGQSSRAYHDSDERTVRDFPILERSVSLHILHRRSTCASCRKPFNKPSAGVDWQQRQTRRYQHSLTDQCRGSSMQAISRNHQIGYRIVERGLSRHASQRGDAATRRLPKRVGLDAFAKRTGHNDATIVVHLRTHQVFDVLDTRTKATVQTFLAGRAERRRLKVATRDRRRAFRDAVQEQCPWALMVIDRFHGITSAMEALQRVRTRLTRQAPKADQQCLKGRRDLLGKAPEELYPATRLALYEVLVNFPALRLAHSLVHGRRRWYALPDVQVARARLRAWRSRVKQADLLELRELAATIRRWRPWILNFFRDRVTNGVTEGINTKIKLRKRIAYGLPNFVHLRARILIAFTSVAALPP